MSDGQLGSNLREKSPRALKRGSSGRGSTPPPLGHITGSRKGLLQAELEGDGQVHGHGFAVERSGLILPLFQSVHGRLLQQGRAGNNFHGGHASIGIDQRVDKDVAGNMLVLRERRIGGRHGRNQLCLFHVTPNGERSCGGGGGRLIVANDETCVERIWVRLIVVG